MKIKINSDGHNFTIPLPNGLILNGIVSGILAEVVNKNLNPDIKIPTEQFKILCKELKRTKKLLNGEPLLYVLSGDSEIKVTI